MIPNDTQKFLTKPKPYYNYVLGGYLLKDVEYEDKLFSKKIAYKIPC